MVSGSWDKTLRVWDLATGASEVLLRGPSLFVSIAAQGDLLVAGDELGNVWMLELRDIGAANRVEVAVQVQGGPTRTLDAPPPALGWLHLSDWHVGMKERGLWPNVRQALFEDLKRLRERVGTWHAVLFTGDLVQQGSAEEYAELKRRLGELWEEFGRLGSEPALVAVPGNHDLVRPSKQLERFRGLAVDPCLRALRLWHAEPELREGFWGEAENEYRGLVQAVFEPYAAWAARDERFARARPTWGRLPGDFSAVLEQGSLRVGLVGLNTGFLQLTGSDYEGKLDADVRQLHAACGGDAPAWLAKQQFNLLLTHHPPTWLEKQRYREHWRSEIAPPGRFGVHLHGHLHDPGAMAVSEGGSAPRHRLQGASLFGLEYFGTGAGERLQRVHGYSAGRVELVGAAAAAGATSAAGAGAASAAAAGAATGAVAGAGAAAGAVTAAGTGAGAAAGSGRAQIRIWPRRLVTKASGKQVLERDPEMELDDSEAMTW